MENNEDLGLALQQMQQNLKRVSDEHLERLWLQSAKNDFEDKIKGEKDLSELLHVIFAFISDHSLALAGALYVIDDLKI
ncbi:MAG TPA: hypothetical protein VFQ50_01775, partial [Flavobacterium sp.]|nr:hypothetical protein [Flavobacterium sp.]